MTDEQIKASETNAGRVRQLIVTLVLATLLTVGLVYFVQYAGVSTEATSPNIYRVYVIGLVVLAINFINADVLLQLVQRLPLPSKLTGQ